MEQTCRSSVQMEKVFPGVVEQPPPFDAVVGLVNSFLPVKEVQLNRRVSKSWNRAVLCSDSFAAGLFSIVRKYHDVVLPCREFESPPLPSTGSFCFHVLKHLVVFLGLCVASYFFATMRSYDGEKDPFTFFMPMTFLCVFGPVFCWGFLSFPEVLRNDKFPPTRWFFEITVPCGVGTYCAGMTLFFTDSLAGHVGILVVSSVCFGLLVRRHWCVQRRIVSSLRQIAQRRREIAYHDVYFVNDAGLTETRSEKRVFSLTQPPPMYRAIVEFVSERHKIPTKWLPFQQLASPEEDAETSVRVAVSEASEPTTGAVAVTATLQKVPQPEDAPLLRFIVSAEQAVVDATVSFKVPTGCVLASVTCRASGAATNPANKSVTIPSITSKTPALVELTIRANDFFDPSSRIEGNVRVRGFAEPAAEKSIQLEVADLLHPATLSTDEFVKQWSLLCDGECEVHMKFNPFRGPVTQEWLGKHLQHRANATILHQYGIEYIAATQSGPDGPIILIQMTVQGHTVNTLVRCASKAFSEAVGASLLVGL